MKHEEHPWKTSDGIEIFAQRWAPDGPPRAAVALVHGLGEHSTRYAHVAERLTSDGFALTAFDHRGHGRSGGPRVFAPSYEAVMGDIDHHLEDCRSRFPKVPVFLYGHSWGGALVLYHSYKRNAGLAGVVASSPGLQSGIPQPALKIAAGKVLSRIAPTLRIPTGFAFEGLTRDKQLLDAAAKDPLMKSGISARLGIDILAAGEWIRGHDTFPYPLLLMQGTADRYVDPATNIEFARRLNGTVTLKTWEGCLHELQNETVRDQVIEFISRWLKQQLR